jgi:CRISPR-associated protein Cmr1
MGMTKLRADFSIVTPLLMGGADPQSAELRVSGMKGMLRFWWRALAWSRLKSVDQVRSEEAKIFGSTEEGQSSVKIRLLPPKKTVTIKKKSVLSYNDGTDAGEGSIYLGYGLIEANGELNRRCLGYPIEDGALELSFLPSTPEDNIKSVEAALLAMGFFGGLGSRSRKGYGSFNLKKLTRDDETDPVFISPSDKDGLKRAILNLFDPEGRYKILRYDGLPPYTAFSKMMRIDILDTSDEPLRLLNSIGDKMMEYRSYRKEKNFLYDYKLIKDALAGNVIYNHPKRSIFGLPHNYYFSSTHESAKVKPKDHERRASPLFIHIQRMNESQFAAITAIIPADFLPHGEKIMVGDSPVDVDVNGYKVLHEFIDGRDTPRFASLVRVI